ncbi:hypothetical protein CBOM_05177 [Ceraceosorus bombacis]|uniref:Uncharacterized protein n=1 Tax=Ceraceosorus bombacis TaxID=401625 RepID=A0A0N7LA96_9BASI|nr:hypothetical protein CBOM_05177 [Ceraceosorus bombacis]
MSRNAKLEDSSNTRGKGVTIWQFSRKKQGPALELKYGRNAQDAQETSKQVHHSQKAQSTTKDAFCRHEKGAL